MDAFLRILQSQPTHSRIYSRASEMLRSSIDTMDMSDVSVDSSTPTTMENTPVTRDMDTPEVGDVKEPPQDEESPQPTFLGMPVDIFRCVADYLDRSDAFTLKLVCRGLSQSKVMDELMYREPVQFDDIREIRLNDWYHKPMGRERWELFRSSIHDGNRNYVQKLAMSHWCMVEDFQWAELNLPKLISLDIAAIKDFVWTPGETWTWKELVEKCPNLFSRLHELEVCNWADYTAHSRIEYNYSYNDYTYKVKFRMSRRRDGGSIPKTILKACSQLKTLGIRGCSRHIAWNEWEVHQRVCCLVDAVVVNSPPTLQTLRLHEMAPFLPLLLKEVSSLEKLSIITVGLCSWMQEHRDNFRSYPFLMHRMIPGSQHRDDEDVFDDGTFEACSRNHMQLGQEAVEGVGYSLSNMLRHIAAAVLQQSTAMIKSNDSLKNVILHPFHFVNVHLPSRHNTDNHDFSQSEEMQYALKWMATTCSWRPVFTWDTMMCDVFPANIDSPTLRPKADIMSQIKRTFIGLRALDIPIRLTIGDRIMTCSNSGLDRSLYFGDFKHFVGEGPDRRQVLEPTEARFNLTGIAHLVDELIIQYTMDMPGVTRWGKSARKLTPGEKALMAREMRGWRKFWARYALQFINLKKLTCLVPLDIFLGWGRSKQLAGLLTDESWQLLEQEVRRTKLDGCLIDGLLVRTSSKKHPRLKFVKRVFFRKDLKTLDLDAPALTEAEKKEENSFPQGHPAIADLPFEQLNRFWPAARKVEKRKVVPVETAEGVKGEALEAEALNDVEQRAKKQKVG